MSSRSSRSAAARSLPGALAAGVLTMASSLTLLAAPASYASAPVCSRLTPTIVGTDGPDFILGTPRRDVVFAGAGDDVVRGRRGNDVLCGGSGADDLGGGAGVDRLVGEDGNDLVRDFAGPGKDRLRGGLGDDRLVTRDPQGELRDGRKTLRGGPGDDVLRSAETSQLDVLLGGHGQDRLISAGNGGRGLRNYPDDLAGGPGVDTILTQRGDMTDVHLVGDGDHVVARHERPDGGAEFGSDARLSWREAAGAVLVDLDAGTGTVVGSQTSDTLDLDGANDVVAYGTPFVDSLFGRNVEEGRDFLHGLRGPDELHGRSGDEDVIIGGRGDDLIDGGPGEFDWGSGDEGTDTCVDVEDYTSCEIGP